MSAPALTAADIPADAVLGTREFPFTASQATAAQFLNRRVLCSHVQRVAQIRLAAGAANDWDGWAFNLARLRLWIPSGWYGSEGWPMPRRWPELTPEALLCGGKGAPFRRRTDVPEKVIVVVGRAIAAAKIAGPSVLSPSGVARALGVTAAFRREHKLWALGAMDADKADLRRQSRKLSAESRKQSGKLTRAEYLDRAALIREACAIARISRDTFDRRDDAVRERLLEAAMAARAESAGARKYKEKVCCVSSHFPQTPDGAPQGACATGRRNSGGEAQGRNRASAVGRNFEHGGRKRAAHPTIVGAAQRLAAIGNLPAIAEALRQLREPSAQITRALDEFCRSALFTKRLDVSVAWRRTADDRSDHAESSRGLERVPDSRGACAVVSGPPAIQQRAGTLVPV